MSILQKKKKKALYFFINNINHFIIIRKYPLIFLLHFGEEDKYLIQKFYVNVSNKQNI